MAYLSITALFILTALAEIFGCYLVYMWWQHNGSVWLLGPAALSLAAFAWLLTLHPAASGRIYAAYAGVYLVTALAWLGLVDGQNLKVSDWLGGGLALLGALIIASGWE
ncbi:YnfA family protein [Phytohalomonas tamaricis]|uniref:YnfA family protein n=1 Tax=Phytohalomonas tamaricis TaxID=2081032 RepID=UPI000D0BA399|nr:YnfA family protein [Phytohalomonas tamaricis]